MTGAGFLAVGVGAALGAWLRWMLNIGLNTVLPNLALGTLASNLIGGYLIGVAVEYVFQQGTVPLELRLFVITGFLGGLTTFSSFSAEAAELLMRAQYGWAALMVSSHLIGSIALTFLGVFTVRALAG